ncbi:MAG: hypothetical protein C0498_06240 [Anaerolinea sp.]|nr:hypothetical protein [Anaerolinea sp.]
MLGTRAGFLLLLVALAVAGCGISRLGPGPAPASGQRCEGIPAAVCDRMLADARRQAPAGVAPVVGIRIVCTTTCTEAAGEASVVVTYANGQTVESMQGWASPIGPPQPGGPIGVEPTPLPLEPVCLGVGRERCLEFAAAGLASAGLTSAPSGASPVSVTVRCTTVCDTSQGKGTTVVRLADGSWLTGDWAYSGADGQPPP